MKEWRVLLLSLTAAAFVLFAGAGTASAADGGKILIAYFSRADENYQVGYVEKGNTQVLAEAVAEATGGELFRIETERPYPKEYRETTEVAKREQNEGARPKLKSTPPDIGFYDVIFLGYPNWWGDMPMAVYTFLESYGSGAFAGKRIIPVWDRRHNREALPRRDREQRLHDAGGGGPGVFGWHQGEGPGVACGDRARQVGEPAPARGAGSCILHGDAGGNGPRRAMMGGGEALCA
mgnify:CR=1 FL=1